MVVCDFHTWMCDWNYSIWLHALWWGKVYELLDRVLVLIVFFYTSMMKSTATPRGRSNQERFWFLLYFLSLFTCSLLWVVLAILDGLLVAIWHEKRGCRGGWEVLIIIGVWQIWVMLEMKDGFCLFGDGCELCYQILTRKKGSDLSCLFWANRKRKMEARVFFFSSFFVLFLFVCFSSLFLYVSIICASFFLMLQFIVLRTLSI